ncbi:helix-turn-helix transcriptional regulator [Desulfosporosinus sp. Sb-LF]|nr:helix-turn-helix transcriptional regulator [Desulfosporosinus sp. Sb-LF]TGE34520.1 XRE family transcriptional regulator [Desulfosporosinus sp. Sb-LF]
MIENGRRKPGFALAKRIADFFTVTVDELFF